MRLAIVPLGMPSASPICRYDSSRQKKRSMTSRQSGVSVASASCTSIASSMRPIVSVGHLVHFRLGLLAPRRPVAVDAEPAGQLAEPGSYRLVVSQFVEVRVRTREHFLEDVLGVVFAADGRRFVAMAYT